MTARRRSKVRRRIWVLTQVDVIGCTSHPHADSLVAHVASSRAKAGRYVARHRLDPTGWWELRAFDLDTGDIPQDWLDQEVVGWFDHRGKPVARPPHARAFAAFHRERQAEIAAGVFASERDHDCAAAATRRRRRGPAARDW